MQKSCQPPYIISDALQHDGIAHGFFGRQGGVSRGFCESLNTTFFKENDTNENVEENRQRIANALGFSLIRTVKQVHQNHVVVVDSTTPLGLEADAMVSKTPGILLGIQTADCAPILLYEPQAKIIAAIHAGWRSACKRIIDRTIQAMVQLGATQNKILAAIGPCIQQENYEVGQDVFEQVNNSCFFINSLKMHHYLFDLPGYILNQLEKNNIQQIASLGIDTYAREAEYFSFRRSTHQQRLPCGGQISAIGIIDI